MPETHPDTDPEMLGLPLTLAQALLEKVPENEIAALPLREPVPVLLLETHALADRVALLQTEVDPEREAIAVAEKAPVDDKEDVPQEDPLRERVGEALVDGQWDALIELVGHSVLVAQGVTLMDEVDETLPQPLRVGGAEVVKEPLGEDETLEEREGVAVAEGHVDGERVSEEVGQPLEVSVSVPEEEELGLRVKGVEVESSEGVATAVEVTLEQGDAVGWRPEGEEVPVFEMLTVTQPE